MATTKKLYIVFGLKNQRNMTISLDDPKEELTTEDVEPVAQSIVDTKFFAPGGSVVTSVKDAYIREVTTTDLITA